MLHSFIVPRIAPDMLPVHCRQTFVNNVLQPNEFFQDERTNYHRSVLESENDRNLTGMTDYDCRSLGYGPGRKVGFHGDDVYFWYTLVRPQRRLSHIF